MTDEELIARLREMDGWVMHGARTHLAAADRIEALSISNATLIAERDEAEAKLPKAVEALEDISGNGNAAGRNPQLMSAKARTTLAEIKSHSDEFATQKGESHE